MYFLRQLLLILGISFLGEVLHVLIPLPIPASVYGLIVMLLCLHSHVFPLKAVEKTGNSLIDTMPVLFIPPTVGIMAVWDQLRPILLPVAIITVVSLVAVMVVTGKVTQGVIRWKRKDVEEPIHG